jgi:hypothetical protein
MSQDKRGDGVQVVGGSNPPCPTSSNPNPSNNFYALTQSVENANNPIAPSSAPSRDATKAPQYYASSLQRAHRVLAADLPFALLVRDAQRGG